MQSTINKGKSQFVNRDVSLELPPAVTKNPDVVEEKEEIKPVCKQICMKEIPTLKSQRPPLLLTTDSLENDAKKTIESIEEVISNSVWKGNEAQVVMKNTEYDDVDLCLIWYIIKKYDVVQLALQSQGVIIGELQKSVHGVSFKLIKYFI